jgi:hypothetical protein
VSGRGRLQHTGVVGKRGTQTLTRGLSLHEATRTHPLLLTTRAKAGQTHNTVAAEASTHLRNGVCKVLFCGHSNDPSAGSPTETLLRLLLPLDDQV